MNTRKKLFWLILESIYFTIGFLVIYQIIEFYILSSGTIFSLRNVLFVIPLGILLSFIIFYFIYRVNDKNFDAQRYLVIYSIYNKSSFSIP